MKPQSAILEPVPDHARHADALSAFIRPLTGGWCPPLAGAAVDLSALG